MNQVVADDNLSKAVKEMAQKILKNDLHTVRIFKTLINQGMRVDLDSGLKIGANKYDE